MAKKNQITKGPIAKVEARKGSKEPEISEDHKDVSPGDDTKQIPEKYGLDRQLTQGSKGKLVDLDHPQDANQSCSKKWKENAAAVVPYLRKGAAVAATYLEENPDTWKPVVSQHLGATSVKQVSKGLTAVKRSLTQ